MAKASYAGPSEKLGLYEMLVASVEGVERKGAANPYTSRNGHMTSFIDTQGEVSIRLDEASRAEFIDPYESRISEQHGAQMNEFVVVPDELLERHDEIREWFARSWEWVGAKKPK